MENNYVEDMNTGEKIKQHRLLKKISPKDIAAVLDMDVSNYYRIERDEIKPDIENLIKIAEYMQIDPKELLSDDKTVFNITASTSNINSHFIDANQPTVYSDQKLAGLLEDKVKLLEEKIDFILAENARLKVENASLKAK